MKNKLENLWYDLTRSRKFVIRQSYLDSFLEGWFIGSGQVFWIWAIVGGLYLLITKQKLALVKK